MATCHPSVYSVSYVFTHINFNVISTVLYAPI
uniref:Uncharacterized protein n=1 Tax=Myoviridae sp. ct6F13 TaxID=2827602 RepID=A0A8S5LJQ4_9CAUD|nr:MAG TPA: hypothetical protein [Myoviridae sp. ct6F13]